MTKKPRKFSGQNAGTTMIEVLIAFVVLTIVLTSFYYLIQFSQKMTMSATDIKNENEVFNSEVAKGESLAEGVESDAGVTRTRTSGSFKLVPDTASAQAGASTVTISADVDIYTAAFTRNYRLIKFTN